jgi:hypothetical protein
VLTMLGDLVQTLTSSVDWTFLSMTLATSAQPSIKSLSPDTDGERAPARARTKLRGAQAASGATAHE